MRGTTGRDEGAARRAEAMGREPLRVRLLFRAFVGEPHDMDVAHRRTRGAGWAGNDRKNGLVDGSRDCIRSFSHETAGYDCLEVCVVVVPASGARRV